MLNKIILMGRLTRDPELRHTQSNTPVASFTLAVDRDRKENGERKTDFFDCVAWGKRGEFVSQWFTKGQMAIVCGRLESRSWEDRNGNKRVAIEINADEIQFGESKKSREEGAQDAPRRSASVSADDFSELDDDSDVPF